MLVYYQNAHSIYVKTSYLKSVFHQLSSPPDILIFTQTWLQPDFSSMELGLHNYNVYRKDRNLAVTNLTKGGRVLIVIKKDIEALIVSLDSSVEHLYIKLNFCSTKILLGVTYFNPDMEHEQFLHRAHDVEYLFTKYNDDQYILIGDYNIRNVAWSSNPLEYTRMAYMDPNLRSKADTICETYTLLNLEHLPPHPLKGYTTDLLFAPSNFVSLLDSQEQILPTDSHHEAYFFEINSQPIVMCSSTIIEHKNESVAKQLVCCSRFEFC